MNQSCGIEFLAFPFSFIALYFGIIQIPIIALIYRLTPKEIWDQHKKRCLETNSPRIAYHESILWRAILVGELQVTYLAKFFKIKEKEVSWWNIQNLPMSVIKLLWISTPLLVIVVLFFIPGTMLFSACELFYKFF